MAHRLGELERDMRDDRARVSDLDKRVGDLDRRVIALSTAGSGAGTAIVLGVLKAAGVF
jgi:hypothetical protein